MKRRTLVGISGVVLSVSLGQLSIAENVQGFHNYDVVKRIDFKLVSLDIHKQCDLKTTVYYDYWTKPNNAGAVLEGLSAITNGTFLVGDETVEVTNPQATINDSFSQRITKTVYSTGDIWDFISLYIYEGYSTDSLWSDPGITLDTDPIWDLGEPSGPVDDSSGWSQDWVDGSYGVFYGTHYAYTQWNWSYRMEWKSTIEWSLNAAAAFSVGSLASLSLDANIGSVKVKTAKGVETMETPAHQVVWDDSSPYSF